MEHQIDRFNARAEDGRLFSVVIYQEFVDGTAIGDEAKKWIPGMKRIALSDGSSVNFVDQNTFRIVQTGEIIRRV
jgi:hypothetical protein